MPDSPQQRHQRVLLPRYGTHFSTVHSHVVLQLRRCINSIFGTGIISQCCDGGVDPAVHPELRDLRGYAENTLLASLYGHHLICILSAMLHVGRSQAGRALPCVRPWLLCVPRTPPWPHLAKYNAARWPFTARARIPGRSAMASLRPPDAAMASPSQVQCCTLADHGPGAQNPV